MRLIDSSRLCTAIAATVMLTASGCAFQGVNSLPLPGTVGRGLGSATYHVELTNSGALEPNSPVLIDDVVVGAVDRISVKDRHARVDITVRRGVVVPANAVAAVGQTSLLGSMHLQLSPPADQAPTGALPPGATIALTRTTTYPSTEQTLASLSAVVNPGGLGQIGSIIHDFNDVMGGREPQIRELLGRLDAFVGTLNDQRNNIIDTMTEMNRLAGTLAGQQGVIAEALHRIPLALDVLLKERPNLVTALDRLRVFSDTATGVVNDTQAYLVQNLRNLEPTIRALADVGPELGRALAYLTVFPLGQDIIDRGIRGDYVNLFATIDLTNNRVKRGLLAGTRLGDRDAPLVPAPGDAGYDAFYTRDPLGAGVAATPPAAGPTTPPPGPTAPGPVPSDTARAPGVTGGG